MGSKMITDITSAQTTMNDTDNFILQETAGGTTKKTLWSTIKSNLKTYFDTLYSPMNVSTVYKQASYAILDNDGYQRIEVDTTDGAVAITLPLMANNTGRRIEIAFVKNDASADVITISPHATDANKLSSDGLASIILSKVGDFITVQQSDNSGFWEIINERITSQLRLNTYAGYGSTDNKIMRFANSVENVGNMFSENHASGYNSNADGLEITINRSGRYAFCFVVCATGAGGDVYFGLSLNSSSLTTSVFSIGVSERIALADTGASATKEVSSTIYLKKGDIVRPHTDGGAPGATAYPLFSAVYLGQ